MLTTDSPDAISIERVTDALLPTAARIHALSWQASHRSFCTPEFVALHTPARQQAMLSKVLSDGGALYLLTAERPVAVVSVQGSLIENLYVLPEAQNRGYGTRLLTYAIGQCEGDPTLWILENNAGARRLYERLGFCATGRQNRLSDTLSELEFRLER